MQEGIEEKPNDDTTKEVGEQQLCDLLKEAAYIIHSLAYYGRLHIIKNIIYGVESHEQYLSRAMHWENHYRSLLKEDKKRVKKLLGKVKI